MIRESNGKYWHNDTEITESEYLSLLSTIKEKAALVNDICSGKKTIDDVPAEWQEEISQRVQERNEEEEPEPTPDEALNILLGGAGQ